MYSTPAQPILPYAFKPRNYVIRFYSVFIPFVHPQVFPVKFFKRFTRFSPIFPNFLSYNQLYIYIRITNDSLVQKNFLATICLWCRILYTFLGCSALRIHSVQFVLYKSRVVATKRNEFLTFFYLCVVENDSWRKTKKDGVLEECVWKKFTTHGVITLLASLSPREHSPLSPSQWWGWTFEQICSRVVAEHTKE